jgi:PKD repeat protein
MSTTLAQAQVTSTALYELVRSMPENSWAKANRNSFRDVWAPPEHRTLYTWDSNRTPEKIIWPWSSFGWDTLRGDVILFGGGHQNYAGNEVYRWLSSTLMWERASLPSEKVYLRDNNFTAIDGPDAAPMATHTYDNSTYLPILDRFITFGGAAYQTGGAWKRWTDETRTALRYTGPYLWNPALADPWKVGGTTGSHPQHSGTFPHIVGGNMWENRDLAADFANAPTYHVQGCVQPTVENGRDTVYILASRNSSTQLWLRRLTLGANPDDDTLEIAGAYKVFAGGQTTCGLWPERKLFVYTSSGANPIVFFDLTTRGTTNYNKHVSTAGLEPLIQGLSARSMGITHCALKFDPVRENFLIWCGDATVWRLNPPATNATTGWTVQTIQGGGTPPVKKVGTGILGKWKYAPGFDVFIGVMDQIDGSVWVYKPVGWIDPGTDPTTNAAPTVSPSATPSTARVGATIVFAANARDRDGTIASTEWQFGDGTTMSGENVSRAFDVAGSYSARVTAMDDAGAIGSDSVIVTITPNAAPIANATATPVNVTVGQAVSFSAGARDADGSVASIAWAFGDGATGEGASPTHAYGAAGIHTATVTVTDNEGATGTDTVAVSVTEGPPGDQVTIAIRQGDAGYAGAQDTHLDRYYPNTVRGGGTSLNVDPAHARPLLRFAIFQAEGGPVPNGAEIVSAELVLMKWRTYDHAYELQRMLVPWLASQATWNQRLTGVPWTLAGANGSGTDFASTPDASASVGVDPALVRFDVTARLRTWSLQAANGTLVNHGWRVRWRGGDWHYVRFDSSEASAAGTVRPTLNVTFR